MNVHLGVERCILGLERPAASPRGILTAYRLNPSHLAALPVFPLRRVVLFPGALVSLHIFEPRYRQMIADVLREGTPLAIAMPVGSEELEGAPSLRKMIGVGTIERHELLSDGRSNVVIEGRWRAQVLEEVATQTLYRRVKAEVVSDEVVDFAHVTQQMETLQACLMGLQSERAGLAGALRRMAEPSQRPARVCDRLAAQIFPEPQERQKLLEEPCVDRRMDQVVTRISELLLCVSASESGDHEFN